MLRHPIAGFVRLSKAGYGRGIHTGRTIGASSPTTICNGEEMREMSLAHQRRR